MLRDVVGLLDEWYPPATADSWDAVGLVAGDPDAPVGKVLLAVDPVAAGGRRGRDWGADLLVVHHPLFLKAGARGGGDHGQGPHAGHPDGGRLRTAHGPHQRRPGA